MKILWKENEKFEKFDKLEYNIEIDLSCIADLEYCILLFNLAPIWAQKSRF